MIQAEKMIEASMQIGKGPRAAASNAEGGTQSQEMQQQARMSKETSASGTVKGENKGSQGQMTDAEAKKNKDANNLLATMYITNPGQGSLMQRMASPSAQVEKKGPNSTFGNTLMTTMANTQQPAGAGETSMNSSQGSMIDTRKFPGAFHASPFRETIQRGMVTGVGLFSGTKTK